jgi:hypothetical protein
VYSSDPEQVITFKKKPAPTVFDGICASGVYDIPWIWGKTLPVVSSARTIKANSGNKASAAKAGTVLAAPRAKRLATGQTPANDAWEEF